MNRKIATVISKPAMISDDGRLIGNLEYMLFLNDNNGEGRWHGGPNNPNHCSVYPTQAIAEQRAVDLGYTVVLHGQI